MVGSLRYFADTHPALAFIVGVLGCHLHQPVARHVAAAHRVLRYLKGVRDQDLTYSSLPSSNTPLYLEAFSDSDWAQCPDSRRSTTGIVFTLAGAPIHWVSSKQSTVAQSSAEAEYVAAAHAARDLTWITQLAAQWHIHLHDPSRAHGPLSGSHASSLPYDLCIDNKGAIDMASASGPTKRTKHIDVKHHYIQQQIKARTLRLVQVPSANQKADLFTKPLPRVQFLHNLSQLSIPSVIEGGC
jgi:hypothetical protein